MNTVKIISLILTACMLLTVSGCAKNTANNNTQSGSATGFATVIEAEQITEMQTETNKNSVKEVTDFTFLNDKTGMFSDAEDDGTWYPGKVERNIETGEVTYIWDRAQDTLDYIKEYGAIYRGDESQKVCYLTFDCGYEYKNDEYPNGVTVAILDILKEKNVKGTFFITGAYVKEGNTGILQRMLNEGHIIGNHTLNHKNQISLTAEEFVYEIMETERLFEAAFPDAPNMIYYRPPGGSANEFTLALAKEMGLTTVFWSAAQPDYDVDNQLDPGVALEKAKKALHNGCVYLIHAISTTNAKMLGSLIDYIRLQGFEMRLISECK